MKTETTMRYHLTPVRMANINKSKTSAGEDVEKGEQTLVHFWWERRLVQPLRKAVWSYLKKLKMELPYGPATPLLGIIERNLKH